MTIDTGIQTLSAQAFQPPSMERQFYPPRMTAGTTPAFGQTFCAPQTAPQTEFMTALSRAMEMLTTLMTKVTELVTVLSGAEQTGTATPPATGTAPAGSSSPAGAATAPGTKEAEAVDKGSFRGFLNSLADAFDDLLGKGSFLGKTGKKIKSVSKMFTSVFSGGLKKALSSIF